MTKHAPIKLCLPCYQWKQPHLAVARLQREVTTEEKKILWFDVVARNIILQLSLRAAVAPQPNVADSADLAWQSGSGFAARAPGARADVYTKSRPV